MTRWRREDVQARRPLVRDLWSDSVVPLDEALTFARKDVEGLRETCEDEGAEWGDRLDEAEVDLDYLEATARLYST